MLFPLASSSRLHLPGPLCSTPVTALHRSYGTSVTRSLSCEPTGDPVFLRMIFCSCRLQPRHCPQRRCHVFHVRRARRHRRVVPEERPARCRVWGSPWAQPAPRQVPLNRVHLRCSPSIHLPLLSTPTFGNDVSAVFVDGFPDVLIVSFLRSTQLRSVARLDDASEGLAPSGHAPLTAHAPAEGRPRPAKSPAACCGAWAHRVPNAMGNRSRAEARWVEDTVDARPRPRSRNASSGLGLYVADPPSRVARSAR